MGLPTKPATAPATSTAAATAPAKAATAAPAASSAPAGTPVTAAESTTAGKVVIKQFGPAKLDNGDTAPVPAPQNVSLVDVNKQLFAGLSNILAAAGVTDIPAFLEEVSSIDKTSFPGHKDGRVGYATAGVLVNIGKTNALLNKVRGATGGAIMKKKLEEKDSRIKDLEAQLAALMGAQK